MDNLDCLIIENEEGNEINDENEVVVPVKKPKKKWCIPNQAQLDGMAKGRSIRDENARIRKEARELKAQEDFANYEKKVLDKALSIRRRQIKQEYLLNQIPDDNTSEEEMRKMRPRQQPHPQLANKPQPIPEFTFC